MTASQFWIYMFTIAISPLIAVQVTEFVNRRREANRRRVSIFRSLMATRAARVAPDHVQALNMIDLDFRGDDRLSRAVIEAWKAYLAHLNNRGLNADLWFSKGDDLFYDLLYAISRSLDYPHEKTDLRGTSYSPEAHGKIEQDLGRIRLGLAELLDGKRALPIRLPAPAAPETPSAGV